MDMFNDNEQRCEDCEKITGDVRFTNCPYAEEIHEKQVPVYLCQSCYKERCMDI